MAKHRWFAIVAMSLAFRPAWACQKTISLEGVETVETCDARNADCVPGATALHEYLDRIPDDDADVVTIGAQASPWRIYDADMRIQSIDEMAAIIKPHLQKGGKRVVLYASWTGARPANGKLSVAERLSAALDGSPVRGLDGFLWISESGEVRTTRQALTVKKGSGPYGVPAGKEVMASLVAGWWSELEDHFVTTQDADGLMRAGAGWDIYFLCPDGALRAFEAAAKLKNPIAAYNAAVMRLERNEAGDADAAKQLLALAEGDEKSRLLLDTLQNS